MGRPDSEDVPLVEEDEEHSESIPRPLSFTRPISHNVSDRDRWQGFKVAEEEPPCSCMSISSHALYDSMSEKADECMYARTNGSQRISRLLNMSTSSQTEPDIELGILHRPE